MVGFPLCFSPRKILGLNHAPKGTKGKGITTWQKISEDQGNHGNSCWFYHALTMTNKAFLLKHLVVVISDFFSDQKTSKGSPYERVDKRGFGSLLSLLHLFFTGK